MQRSSETFVSAVVQSANTDLQGSTTPHSGLIKAKQVHHSSFSQHAKQFYPALTEQTLSKYELAMKPALQNQ
jgi:hypothetical protein